MILACQNYLVKSQKFWDWGEPPPPVWEKLPNNPVFFFCEVPLLVLSFIFWVITFGANGAPKLFSAEKYVSPNFSNANSLRSVWRVEVNLKGTVFPPKLSHYFPPIPGYCEKIIACLCPSLWKSPLKIFSKTKITSQDKIHLSRYALPGVCLSSLSLKAEISLEATKTFLLSCRWKTIRQNAHQP